MSSPVPRRSLLNSRIVVWVLGMVAAFAVMYYSLPKKQGGPTGPAASQGISAAANSSLCEGKLIKWIQSVDPERLQFNTDIESRIQELNRYWRDCGPPGDDPIVSDLQPIEAAVSGDYRERVLTPRFGRRDIEHIRQSLLLSRMATRIGETQKTDLERALAALVLISQQIEPLAADSATDHPLTPFECLLLGQGTAADRAWTWAEIMRQLHLDTIVLTTSDAAIPPLMGVIIESEVYLFDPFTGLPVPAAGESQRKTLFREPATLRAALADDSILRQLDLEGTPFPWTTETLKTATVGLVGTSNTWSPRLAELQFQWPTAQLCVIYDGLGSSAGLKRGLVARVSEALAPLGYEAGRVQVWDYPERQCARYDALGAEGATHMLPLVAVMSGPTRFEEVIDPVTGRGSVVLRNSKPALQQVRVQHLLGHYQQAIGGYLPMLGVHLSAPPPGTPIDGPMQAAMDRNRIVADKATYWMAATQFESNNISACGDTLKRYAKKFPLGEMREAAAMRVAACLVKAQEHGPAALLLLEIGPGPHELRRKLHARRLLELSQKPEPAPASSP